MEAEGAPANPATQEREQPTTPEKIFALSMDPLNSEESAEKTEQPLQQQWSSGYNTGRWSEAEHGRFLDALDLYGKDWKKV